MGKNYQEAVNDLGKAGFRHIRTVREEKRNPFSQSETVSEIVVDGKKGLKEYTWIPADADIAIHYEAVNERMALHLPAGLKKIDPALYPEDFAEKGSAYQAENRYYRLILCILPDGNTMVDHLSSRCKSDSYKVLENAEGKTKSGGKYQYFIVQREDEHKDNLSLCIEKNGEKRYIYGSFWKKPGCTENELYHSVRNMASVLIRRN